MCYRSQKGIPRGVGTSFTGTLDKAVYPRVGRPTGLGGGRTGAGCQGQAAQRLSGRGRDHTQQEDSKAKWNSGAGQELTGH